MVRVLVLLRAEVVHVEGRAVVGGSAAKREAGRRERRETRPCGGAHTRQRHGRSVLGPWVTLWRWPDQEEIAVVEDGGTVHPEER